MGLIDLDAARAARLETAGPRPGFLHKGETFTFPSELPLLIDDTIDQAKDEKWPSRKFLKAYMKALIGDEQWRRFVDLGATDADLQELFDRAMEQFGASTGESGASASSSRSAGASSKRKSRGSTKKTPARTSSRAARAGS